MSGKSKKKNNSKFLGIIIAIVVILAILFLLWKTGVISVPGIDEPQAPDAPATDAVADTPADAPVTEDGGIPEYTGTPYYVLNDNNPEFKEDEITSEAYEYFSELDELGRCGVVHACVGRELMPTEDRESISHVKPSGWVNVPYDFVDGRYLYNRSHLIGFQLTGENDNELNLITGTRYFNVEGMLPFENMVADYVKETDNHVMYRVTPIYDGDDLVCKGVQMEAWSVEDKGDGLCYNVYIYNVQPGVVINYRTGESREADSDETVWPSEQEEKEEPKAEKGTFILNTNSKKFHLPDCSGAKDMNPANREEYKGSRQALIDDGYSPCGQCDA